MDSEEIKQQIPEVTLSDKLQNQMNYWTNVVKEMSDKMKNIADIDSLLNQVYVKRQECVEYLQGLILTLSRLNRSTKREYAMRYQNYKMNSQLRYTSDSAINTQIEVELEEKYTQIDFIKTHIEMMRETLVTINDLIYGIKERVELYQIMNGMKF